MAITSSTLFSAARTAVYDILKANVLDPITRSTTRRRFIYREEPDTTARGFAGYPFIVLRPADIGNEEYITLGADYLDDTYTFEVEVVSQFNDERARLDEISDGIIDTLRSNTQTLEAQGLFNLNLNSSAALKGRLDGTDTHSRLLILSFDRYDCR